jgi:AraC-like DNA-binding protein
MFFADWRQQIPLAEAMVRLVSGELIGAIAVALGYENIGWFSRMFRYPMGASPCDFNRRSTSAAHSCQAGNDHDRCIHR